MSETSNLSGALLCARYAFAPNLYQYCGPDTKGDIGEYLKAQLSDGGLVEHLSKFETLYPYFTTIAHANHLSDPLDPRVVEAYWLGNSLLENVKESELYDTFVTKLKLKKRLPKKSLNTLLPKIDLQAHPHHSFHVFNVFFLTGHFSLQNTVDTMDQCRISWGKITKILDSKPQIEVNSQKLIYQDGQLSLKPSPKTLISPNETIFQTLKRGDYVSSHWGFVCDKINLSQVKQLEKYTLHHMRLANETI